MEHDEATVRSELWRILAVQELVLERLQRLAADLPTQRARRGRNRRRAVRLRSAIECLVTDSIRPGIESLRAALEPPAVAEEAGAAAIEPGWSEEAGSFGAAVGPPVPDRKEAP